MARLRLRRNEVERGDLPDVCMCCGEPAVTHTRKTFAWYPPWVFALLFAGLLPFALVALILTKRMTVHVPFCANHKNHWFTRTLYGVGGLFVVLLLPIGIIILLAALDLGRELDYLYGVFFALWALAFFAWLIALVVMQSTAIRPAEITDRSITLTKVSPRFVEMLESTARRVVEDEDYPPRRRYVRDEADEFYDPRNRPPNRRASNWDEDR